MTITTSPKMTNATKNNPATAEAQPQGSQVAMSSSTPTNDLSQALTNLTITPTAQTNPETPPTFHSFPLLPTELRLQIWALALPNSQHVIPVQINTAQVSTNPAPPSAAAPTSNLSFTFCPVKHQPISPSVYEIGMSGACRESRAVYLEHNASSLPLVSTRRGETLHEQCRLHFRAEDAVIYIHNYSVLQRNGTFAAAVKAGAVRDGFLGGIRHLATKTESFFPSVEREAWSGRGGGPSIRIFPNLESWECVEHISRVRVAEEEMRRVRGRLEVFKEKFEPEWKVPVVQILDELLKEGWE